MSERGPVRKKLPFAAERDSDQFQRELIIRLIREFDERRKKHIPTENLQIFYHGTGWTFQRQEPGGYSPHSGAFKLQSVGVQIRIDRILANDTTLVSDFLRETADRQEKQLFHTLVGEMNAVAEEAGNTISMPKSGSMADAFLELIRTTEPIVGPSGTISRPTLFLAPKMIEKLERDVAERGPEFHNQVEALWREKEKQALDRESQRLAQYDRPE
jgi:hypothetical protein